MNPLHTYLCIPAPLQDTWHLNFTLGCRCLCSKLLHNTIKRNAINSHFIKMILISELITNPRILDFMACNKNSTHSEKKKNQHSGWNVGYMVKKAIKAEILDLRCIVKNSTRAEILGLWVDMVLNQSMKISYEQNYNRNKYCMWLSLK